MDFEKLLFRKTKEAVSEKEFSGISQPDVLKPQEKKDESDLEGAVVDSREEDLARIDELEEEAGFDLTETKEEVGGEIEGLKEEGDAGKVREALIGHIGSQAYLDRLEKEFSGDSEKAKKAQGERLRNVSNVKIDTLLLKNITEEFKKYKSADIPRKYLDEILENNIVFGFYNSDKHSVIVPSDADDYEGIRSNKEIATHELGHAMTRMHSGIPDRTKNILKDSYASPEGGAVMNGYFIDSSERLVRKQAVDFEMERLGIKGYGDKFTKDHQDKLMEYYEKGGLSIDAMEFIKTTKPEYFERIFNEIAENEQENNYSKAA